MMADAEADAEAAFINSMQAKNNVAGSYEATGAARQHKTDSISSDEYAPAQAVQSPDSNQTFSFDSSKHDALPAISIPPMTSNPAATAHLSLDTPATQARSQSEPTSRATSSSSSTENHPGPESDRNGNGPVPGDQEQGGGVEQYGTDGRLGIDRDVSDPASSLSNTSINRLSTKDVLIQNDVQDQSASAVIQNGAPSNVSNHSVVSPDVGALPSIDFAAKSVRPASAAQIIETASSAVEHTTTPSIAAPRMRLPHDRIGILEDRIKEDPIGDLDAWLNLIGEHRKRGKLEDARKAYERFLGVFPTCVSVVTNLPVGRGSHLTFTSRPNNGSRMPKWRMSRRIEPPWRRSLTVPCCIYPTSSFGPCISITYAVTTTLPRTRQARHVKSFTRRMSLLCSMLALIKTLVDYGKIMSNF